MIDTNGIGGDSEEELDHSPRPTTPRQIFFEMHHPSNAGEDRPGDDASSTANWRLKPEPIESAEDGDNTNKAIPSTLNLPKPGLERPGYAVTDLVRVGIPPPALYANAALRNPITRIMVRHHGETAAADADERRVQGWKIPAYNHRA